MLTKSYRKGRRKKFCQLLRDIDKMNAAYFVFLLASLRTAVALVGYDCSGSTLNVTTFSTIDKPKCDYTADKPSTQDIQVQLLQMIDYDDTHVYQCKIEIDRTIYHCGMHSHTSVVHNGRQQYILSTPREICRLMHDSGNLFLPPSTQITGLIINSTTSRSVTLAGSLQQDGTCGGTTYSDPFGTWNEVVVQAVIKITLRERYASVKLSDNDIILPSGQHCKLSKEYCMDSEDGYTYWNSIPSSQCKFNEFDMLYEGKSAKTTSRNDTTVIYTVATGDTAFALTSTGRTTVCGYTLIKTEHPKLLIIETEKEGKFKTHRKTKIANIDIFSYINTKFVYTEKHIKHQVTAMYKDIMKQKCKLERQILRNAVALVHTSPAEVATTLVKEPGYMAIQSGEVIHIVKCIPIQVTLRKTKECYDELPVSHRNESYFITPRHRILTKVGTQRECNELIAPTYRIHGTWYRMTPRPVETVSPTPLQPLTESAWRYTNPANLANGGIYSQEEIQKFNAHIMFPIEKTAIVNSIAQGASGRAYSGEAVNLYNLMDEKTLEKLAESTSRRLWKGFVEFGSAMAGIIGVYTAFKIIKICINTILNGLALHNAYGCGIQLIAACWSALTHFCLFLSDKKETSASNGQKPVECVSVPMTIINEPTENEQSEERRYIQINRRISYSSD